MSNDVMGYCDRPEDAGDIWWTAHPKFSGLFLKLLIREADTESKVTCYLAKVDHDCMLDEHVRAGE